MDVLGDWTTEQDESFETLKVKLTEYPVLVHFEAMKPTMLRTDACGYGLGGILLQDHGEGFQPVIYLSKLLSEAERKWGITEKECFAMVYSIDKCRQFLAGMEFTVETDHCPLCWLKSKNTIPSPRLWRWMIKLQDYNFNIVYKEGRLHKDVDCLSRYPEAGVGEVELDNQGRLVSISKANATEARAEARARKRELKSKSLAMDAATGESCMVVTKEVVTQTMGRGENGPECANNGYCTCEEWGRCFQTDPGDGEVSQGGKIEHRPEAIEAMGDQETELKPSIHIICRGDGKERILHDLIMGQEADHHLANIIKEVTTGDKSENGESKLFPKFHYLGDILYKEDESRWGMEMLICVPKKMVADVLYALHDDPLGGHLGVGKTLERVRQRFWWENWNQDVAKYIKGCKDCQSGKTTALLRQGELQPIKVHYPFHTIGIDYLGPMPTSTNNNKHILVAIDHFTKLAITKAVPLATAQEAANFLVEQIVLKHGAPARILTDRGRHFTAKMLQQVCNKLSTKHVTTTSYHPQCNGMTERLNRTLIAMMKMYVAENQKDWDEILPYITFAYNTAVHATTKFTPFFLVHGREAQLPIDITMQDTLGDESTSPKQATNAELKEYPRKVHKRLKQAEEIARRAIGYSQYKSKVRRDNDLGEKRPLFYE